MERKSSATVPEPRSPQSAQKIYLLSAASILWTMEQTNLVLLFKLFTVLAMALWVLVFWRPSKGGRPPRPMHPSPADDTVLLWKRRKRKYSG